jgi:hypothetical protein
MTTAGRAPRRCRAVGLGEAPGRTGRARPAPRARRGEAPAASRSPGPDTVSPDSSRRPARRGGRHGDDTPASTPPPRSRTGRWAGCSRRCRRRPGRCRRRSWRTPATGRKPRIRAARVSPATLRATAAKLRLTRSRPPAAYAVPAPARRTPAAAGCRPITAEKLTRSLAEVEGDLRRPGRPAAPVGAGGRRRRWPRRRRGPFAPQSPSIDRAARSVGRLPGRGARPQGADPAPSSPPPSSSSTFPARPGRRSNRLTRLAVPATRAVSIPRSARRRTAPVPPGPTQDQRRCGRTDAHPRRS